MSNRLLPEQYSMPPVSFELVTVDATSGQVVANQKPSQDRAVRGIRCLTAGAVTVVMQDGTVLTDFNLLQGNNPGLFAEIRPASDAVRNANNDARILYWIY